MGKEGRAFMKKVKTVSDRQRRIERALGDNGFKIFRYFILTGLSFVILLPLLTLLTDCIKPSEEVFDAITVYLSRQPTFENIKNAYVAMDYFPSLLRTAMLIIPCVVFQLISCSLAGYGFARFKFPGKNILFGLLIFLVIVPPQVVGMPTFIYYRNFDFLGIGHLIGLFTGEPATVSLIDSVWSMYIPALFGCGIRAALFIYIFNQFYKGLPKDLEEAAYIDGCGHLRTFYSIILPNAIPVLVTVMLFSVVWYYNDTYYSGMFLSQFRTASISLMGVPDAISNLVSTHFMVMTNPYEGILAQKAAGLLFILPLIIIYLPLQKLFIESVDRSGIVG